MKVYISIEIRYPGYEDFEAQEMEIDGKHRLYVGPLSECPEDAIIGRSLVSCKDVAGYMQEAWEAGKRGEDFTIETS